MSTREQRVAGVVAAFVAVAVASAVLLASGRFPYAVATLLAPVLAAVALGLVVATWRLLWWIPVPGAAGFVVALAVEVGQPLALLFGGALLSVVLLVVWPPAIAAGRRWDGPTLRRVAVLLVVLAAAAPAVAVAARYRTVRVDPPDPLLADERAGTYRGVRIGASRRELEARLGPGEIVRGERDIGPDVLTGPSSLPGVPPAVRYDGDTLFVLEDDVVTQIWIADRRAQTRRGVGPGDSMEAFAERYGEAACEEGSIGSDAPIPYPECDVRLGKDRWLYVGGTYDRAGEPAALLILSRRDVYGS